jgi:O-antigen/teichoic acid export membrane protein
VTAESAKDSAWHDLRARVIQGFGWVLTAEILMRVTGFGTTIVLAHLLTPREIGLAAEALVFSKFVFLVADMGLLAALVQRQHLSDDDRNTAFWTSTALGVVLALVLFGLAAPISDLYGEERVEPLVAVLSLSVLITALGFTPGALLTRDLRFRSLELRTIANTFLGSATAIVVAGLGFGPWAIIAQTLVVSVFSTLLLWLALDWRPRFSYSLESLRRFAGFSGYVFGSSMLYFAHTNADNFLIGRYLGAAKLGAYSLAYNAALMPLRTLASSLQNVLFPAMSRIADPRAVGTLWLRANRVLFAFSLPAFLGLVVVAPDFITVVFGSRWMDAVPVLRILAYVGILRSLASWRGTVLLALDRASLLFRLTAVSATLAVISFVVGLQWGIIGVAAAYAVASTVSTAYHLLLVCPVTHVTVSRFLRSLSGVTQAGVAMAAVVLGVRLVLIHEHVAPAARLAIAVAVGLVVFVPLCAWRAPEVVGEVRRLLETRRKTRAARAFVEQVS